MDNNNPPHTRAHDSHTSTPDPTSGMRRAPLYVLLLALAAEFASAAWFQLPPVARHAARALYRATNGVLTPLLFLHACLLLIVVGGILMFLGRQRLPDLGLRARGIVPALLFAATLWGVMQLYALLVAFGDGVEVHLNPQWTTAPGAVVGEVLGNWLGVALYEELMSRGFLLSQLALLFGRLPHFPRRLAPAAALLLSAAVFAAGHLPYLLRHQTPRAQLPFDLTLLFGWGLLFGITYLVTRNLWCNIAVHGLVLAPAMLVATPASEPTTLVLTAAVIVWLGATVLWKRAPAHWRRRAIRRPA